VSNPKSQTPVILEHPFLTAANVIINCKNEFIRLTFGDMTREVNIFSLGKKPRDVKDQIFEVNLIKYLTSEHNEEIELLTEYEFELETKDFNLDQIVESAVNWASSPISLSIEPTDLTLPFIKFPFHRIESLTKHLKYVYLDGRETLLVIIVSHLTAGQEESLVSVLRKHREATGWTMTDIKELNPAILQHHIHLNEEATPKRDP